MRLKMLLALLTALPILLHPQVSPGAKQISLANSDAALSNDVFAAFNNPAGLAQMNWREIGVYYSPAPFGLKELSNAYAVYSQPLFYGTAAIGGMSYGFELYKESRALAAYAYNYLNKFFAGAAINYHSLSIQNYGSDYSFYINAGLLLYIEQYIRWGASITNINHATFGKEKNQIPVIYNTGFSYDVTDNITACVAIEKETSFPFSFRFGLDYEILKYFSIRTGYANEPVRFTAGVGISYSIFNFDYAVFNHQELGLTHQAGIIVSFKDDESRLNSIRNNLFKK
ncbi:MAG: hypothetical protein K8H86_10790 [Ignavibacteriaceae bacterium]|nr:hypothetical protein [Ignavibacteriaceae bacterium]